MDAYRLHRRRSVNNWPALLRRLVVCRALDRIRRRRPTLTINGLSLAASVAEPESDLIAAELAERLPEAIASLPDREGEVFYLRYFESLSKPANRRSTGHAVGGCCCGFAQGPRQARNSFAAAPGGEKTCTVNPINPIPSTSYPVIFKRSSSA